MKKIVMTPRKRVEAVLLNQEIDKIPFTAYENKICFCETERKLRNAGLCIVKKITNVAKQVSPNVKETITLYQENGVQKERHDFQTPYGNLFTVKTIIDADIVAGKVSCAEQHIFKTKEDYKSLEFIIRNRQYIPNHEAIIKMQKMAGEDIFLRAEIVDGLPFHEIMYSIMGIENFCFEWMDNQDEVLKIYQALVEDRRKIYPIIAQSPLLTAIYGGNFMADMIGLDRFEKYIIPDIEECAEILHKHNKLLCSHLDGNNKLLAPQIAKSSLDFIEAFSPYDTDMSIKDAFEAWPNKILWINFPSSVQLESPENIKNTMFKILEEAKQANKLNKLIIGITETVPLDCWQTSFSTILEALNSYEI